MSSVPEALVPPVRAASGAAGQSGQSGQSGVGRNHCAAPLAGRGRGTVRSPSAAALFDQARTALAAADWEVQPAEKYGLAYRAAMRAAAAMLALHGRPHRGRARPASVWVLLASAVPELADWSRFFADRSALHAAVQAGATRHLGPHDADELARQSAAFLNLVERAVRPPRVAR